MLKKFDEDVAKFVDRTLSGKVKVGKYYVESRNMKIAFSLEKLRRL
ncbi:hypothetical protein YSY22_12690 [Brevibacillus formosus]